MTAGRSSTWKRRPLLRSNCASIRPIPLGVGRFVMRFLLTNPARRSTLLPSSYYSQIEPSCSKTDRQVTLRSLTTFFLNRFAIWERWGISSPKPLAWDRSLPSPVADEGRRSVGNRKECRLRHDYASFPGPQTPSSLRAYSSFLSENSIIPPFPSACSCSCAR